MNIGKAAAESGLQPTTIRYYEQIGLITSTRKANGYRDYCEDDINQMRFVNQARSLGFDIEDCRKLLQLYADPRRASADVKQVAESHLAAVEQKIAELTAMRRSLAKLVEACKGDAQPDCPIIESLAQPESV
ncbi:MAG: Cu(I)-responsive transcriptional regulator [Hyphomicrobiaceae bacterium]